MQTSPDEDRGIHRASFERPDHGLGLAMLLLLPVAVFIVALLTIELSHRASYVATLWPPSAIILTALLRSPRPLADCGFILTGGMVAVTLANLAAGNEVSYSVVLGLANTAEVVTAWGLLSVLGIGADILTSFRKMLLFIIVAGGIAPLGGDGVGAIAIGSMHGIAWHIIWLHSYLAHALGMSLVVPFLMSMTVPDVKEQQIKPRFWEAAVMFALVVVIAVCAAYFRSLIFIVVPVVLLATVRFGVMGATIATFTSALIISVFLVAGIGQAILSLSESSERIMGLQILVAFTSLWALPVAALLSERDLLLKDLSGTNARLSLESAQKSHLVMGLHRHLSTAEEKERLRLSHELHDQAGQSLIAAILQLSEIDPLIQGPARIGLRQVRQRMDEMGKTLHRIAWELRPPSIGELGLCKALASYIDDWAEQCGISVDFHCDDPSLDQVPGEIGSAVYRVVQEALTNVVKHAQRPASVSVIVRRANAALQVIVEDNGCGFDVGAVASAAGLHRGLGLDGMRERLLLIGGTLDIESTLGAGTTIFARIPMEIQRSAA